MSFCCQPRASYSPSDLSAVPCTRISSTLFSYTISTIPIRLAFRRTKLRHSTFTHPMERFSTLGTFSLWMHMPATRDGFERLPNLPDLSRISQRRYHSSYSRPTSRFPPGWSYGVRTAHRAINQVTLSIILMITSPRQCRSHRAAIAS